MVAENKSIYHASNRLLLIEIPNSNIRCLEPKDVALNSLYDIKQILDNCKHQFNGEKYFVACTQDLQILLISNRTKPEVIKAMLSDKECKKISLKKINTLVVQPVFAQ
jgi:hypothetical protein